MRESGYYFVRLKPDPDALVGVDGSEWIPAEYDVKEADSVFPWAIIGDDCPVSEGQILEIGEKIRNPYLKDEGKDPHEYFLVRVNGGPWEPAERCANGEKWWMTGCDEPYPKSRITAVGPKIELPK